VKTEHTEAVWLTEDARFSLAELAEFAGITEAKGVSSSIWRRHAARARRRCVDLQRQVPADDPTACRLRVISISSRMAWR